MSPVIDRLGWMLIHSFWEDALIWCGLHLTLLALEKRSPQSRYSACCLALLAMALAPWITVDTTELSVSVETHVSQNVQIQQVSAVVLPSASIEPAPPIEPTSAFHLPNLLPVLVGLWGIGLCLSAARLVIGWYKLQRIVGQPLTAPNSDWERRFTRLMKKAALKHAVRFGETAVVTVPIVAGWLRPVILMPLGVLTSLPVEQVEAVLLHELAHVARCDYLVNLVQCAVETLFFYHPAVWSVSRRIRREREMACDDLAIRWCEDPHVYAEALAGFEELRTPAPLLAVTGEGDLFGRIKRILLGNQPESPRVGLFAMAGLLGAALYLISMFLAPVVAKDLLTAAERIAQIRALRSISVDAENSPFQMTGTIRAEDGGSLPKSLTDLSASSRSQNWSISVYSRNVYSEWLQIKPDHTFTATVDGGTLRIAIWAEGYAPLLLHDLEAKDGKLEVQVVLKRGFPGRIRLVDPDGRPVQGASVKVRTNWEQFQSLNLPSVQTDDDGVANFGNVESDSDLFFTATKSGWQNTTWSVSQWSAKDPSVQVVQKALPTTAVVIDQKTRQPVAGAQISLAEVTQSNPLNTNDYPPLNAEWWGDGVGSLLAKTDKNGAFTLNGLNRDYNYRVYAQVKGYQTMSFPIHPGGNAEVLELPPSLYVRGHILDPNGLLKLEEPTEIRCDYSVLPGPAGPEYRLFKKQPFTVLGPSIPFELTDLHGGAVQLVVDGQHIFDVNLQKSLDDYTIDLAAIPPPTTRKIELLLKTPPGQPPVVGRVDYTNEVKTPALTYERASATLDKGLFRAEMKAPSTLRLESSQLVGYWISPAPIEIPGGSDVFRQEIPVLPAGAIHGRLTTDPQFNGKLFFRSICALTKPAGIDSITSAINGDESMAHALAGDYVTTPLPFGGTYIVIFSNRTSFFASPSTTIDSAHPIIEQDLTIKAHDSIRGRLVDAKNQPLSKKQLRLSYHHGYQTTDFESWETEVVAVSGSDGTFEISDVNFQIHGNYEVVIDNMTNNTMNNPYTTDLRIDGNTKQPVVISYHRISDKAPSGK